MENSREGWKIIYEYRIKVPKPKPWPKECREGEGEHQWETGTSYYVTKSHDMTVEMKCQKCGAERTEVFEDEWDKVPEWVRKMILDSPEPR